MAYCIIGRLTLLTVLATSYIFFGAFGLYDDQKGLFDWKHDYNGLIGKMKYFHWDELQFGNTVLIASENNAIASLSVQTGRVVWCRVLEPNVRGRIDEFLHRNSDLVSIQAGGLFVRSWSIISGNLLWEKSLADDVKNIASGIFSERDEQEVLIIAVSSYIYCLKVENGKEEWKAEIASGDTIERWYLAERDDGSILAVGIDPFRWVTISVFSAIGAVSKSVNVLAPWINVNTNCLIMEDNEHFVCYSPQSGSLQVVSVETAMVFKQTELLDFPLTPESAIEGLVPGLSAINFRFSRDRLVFMVLTTQETFTVHKVLDKTFACESIHVGEKYIKYSKTQFETKKWSSETVFVHEQFILVTLTQLDSKTLQLTSTDQSDGSELTEFSQRISYAQHHGSPTKIFPLLFTKKKDLKHRPGCKLIFLAQDFSLHFAQKNKSYWRREEAMAYIVSVLMVDLPASEKQDKFKDEFGTKEEDLLAMCYKKLKAQFSQLHGFAHTLIDFALGHHHQHAESIDAIEEEDPEEEDLIRDSYNPHKIIVVATAAGKLYGIQSRTGKIAWQQFITDLVRFSSDKQNKQSLVVQRSIAHFPHEPLWTVLGGNKNISLNPVTGSIKQETISHEYKLIKEDSCFELGAEVMQQIIITADKKMASVKKIPEPKAVAFLQRNGTIVQKIKLVSQENKSDFPEIVFIYGHVVAGCAIVLGILFHWIRNV